jgi:hypothetical protein
MSYFCNPWRLSPPTISLTAEELTWPGLAHAMNDQELWNCFSSRLCEKERKGKEEFKDKKLILRKLKNFSQFTELVGGVAGPQIASEMWLSISTEADEVVCSHLILRFKSPTVLGGAITFTAQLGTGMSLLS